MEQSFTNPNRLAESLAARIAGLVEGSGMSLREVAERTSIPLNTLRRRLAGQSPINTTEIASLAQLLGHDASDLLRQSEDELAKGVHDLAAKVGVNPAVVADALTLEEGAA